MARFVREPEGRERAISGLACIARPPDLAEVIVGPLVPELCARRLRREMENRAAVPRQAPPCA